MIKLLIDVMAVYFLFIILFGNKGEKPHAVIIFLSCLLNIAIPLKESIDLSTYISNRSVYILLDGATALALTMFMMFDKTAWKQALLLSFATLCHIMIILSLKNHHAGFFYTWYDELIIAVGLLQMMVSYDGFINALSNLQVLLLRAYHYCSRIAQGLPAQKSGADKT